MSTEYIGKNLVYDPGPPGWRARSSDLTRRDQLVVPASDILGWIPSQGDEDKLFELRPTGRYSETAWSEFVAHWSPRKKVVQIHVDVCGACITEGNHRLRVANTTGQSVTVIVSYFGNIQKHGLVFALRQQEAEELV